MDEAVPGITEIIPSEDSPTVAGSASDLPRMPADDAAAPVDTLPEITYDEQRYPARPRRLRPRDQLRRSNVRRVTTDPRTATGDQPVLRRVAGPPGDAEGRRRAQPSAVRPAQHVAQSLRAPRRAARDPHRGRLVHRLSHLAHHPAGRVVPRCARAGGALGRRSSAWASTPCTPARSSARAGSSDGARPRAWTGISTGSSTQIDPVFGDEEAFRRLTDVAETHGGSVIDDIVPGHTGKGADFRLAEMAFKDYPGIYHMIEIPPEDWHLLPDVPEGRDSVNLDAATEHELAQHGYIIGELQRVIFYMPGVKETNWSVTGARDRRRRRTPVAGCTCTTSRRASPRSTGSTRRSRACAW